MKRAKRAKIEQGAVRKIRTMSKPKFASLTAGLLARKGEAAPAAPAHGFALLRGFTRAPESAPAPEPNIFREERLPPVRRDCVEALPPESARAHKESAPQRFRIVAEPAASLPHTVALRLPDGAHAPRPHRTAVTVRLDEARYLRLKLTGARFHRTNQDLLTAALDHYLGALGMDNFEPAP
jgi:hypothetical protein